MGKGLTAMIATRRGYRNARRSDAVVLISQQSVLLVTIAWSSRRLRRHGCGSQHCHSRLPACDVSDTRMPDVLISEDARLVALPIGVANSRSAGPSDEFTGRQLKRALRPNHRRPEMFDKTAGNSTSPMRSICRRRAVLLH